MKVRSRPRRRPGLNLEALEGRLLPANPGTLTIPLDPTLDQFGDQVVTVQAYGDPSQAGFGIFDTGASAITFSADDQANFASLGGGIPIKVPGGASASGIGGDITGDVSQPGTILADGAHAMSLTFDDFGFPILNIDFGPNTAQATGVQAFVGTDATPDLPTITGTPILNPSPTSPNGLAALVDMQGYQLDFSGLVPGLSVAMPDLHFVPPNTALTATDGTTAPVYVPLGLFGGDNHANPGDAITESPSPIQNDVQLVNQATTLSHQHLLLDTGAQLTVISTRAAQSLGFDLSNPETTITVEGVGGSVDVPGFTLPELDLPLSDGGTLQFTNVPIYVLDVDPQIDGLLGMNLWNTASSVLYDPFRTGGAALGLTFFTNPDRGAGDGSGLALLQQLGSPLGEALQGHQIPGFNVTLGTISGQVYQDTNANGGKDAGEPGLAGRTVYLDTEVNGKWQQGVQHATTDAGGAYSFGGLEPGTYRVREVLATGWNSSGPASGSYTVTLKAGQQVTGEDFGNYQLASTAGTVFEDRNGNGSKDAAEVGLAGRTVYLDALVNGKWQQGVRRATTGAGGAYSFGGLKPGTYAVREVLPSGWVATGSGNGTLAVTLGSGQALPGQALGAFKVISITGTVFDDRNHNGVRNAGEAGLAGWVVYLDVYRNGTVVQTLRAATNGNGAYAFGGLGPGTYVVREQVQPGWGQTVAAGLTYSVTAASGQNVSGDNFGNYRLPTPHLAPRVAAQAADALFAPADLVSPLLGQGRRPGAP
jgi:protocatechuate 3,4-dioxygenase beta subunit